MAVAMVQDDSWGFANATGVTSLSVSANYATTTQSGNLLLCLVSAFVDLGGGSPSPAIGVPVTTGFTWVLVADSGVSPIGSPGSYVTRVALFYIANAGSMSSGLTVTSTVTTPVAGRYQLSLDLFEFSGVAASNPLDTTAAGTGTGTNPSAGTISPTNTDLIFVGAEFFNNVGGAGSGFTLTTNTANADDDLTASEYNLSAIAGSYTADFTAGAVSQAWGCVAGAFFAAVAPPPPPSGVLQQPSIFISS
jgi:hypothetical protein